MSDRFCKDCRHFQPGRHDLSEPNCLHPSSVYQAPVSLVTGQTPEPTQMFCGWARSPLGPATRCGPSGQFWEPREVGFGP
jgi:hypothetical protein